MLMSPVMPRWALHAWSCSRKWREEGWAWLFSSNSQHPSQLGHLGHLECLRRLGHWGGSVSHHCISCFSSNPITIRKFGEVKRFWQRGRPACQTWSPFAPVLRNVAHSLGTQGLDLPLDLPIPWAPDRYLCSDARSQASNRRVRSSHASALRAMRCTRTAANCSLV